MGNRIEKVYQRQSLTPGCDAFPILPGSHGLDPRLKPGVRHRYGVSPGRAEAGPGCGSFSQPVVFLCKDIWPGEAGNPATLHRYAYGLNNPIRYNDPLGLYASEEDFAPMPTIQEIPGSNTTSNTNQQPIGQVDDQIPESTNDPTEATPDPNATQKIKKQLKNAVSKQNSENANERSTFYSAEDEINAANGPPRSDRPDPFLPLATLVEELRKQKRILKEYKKYSIDPKVMQESHGLAQDAMALRTIEQNRNNGMWRHGELGRLQKEKEKAAKYKGFSSENEWKERQKRTKFFDFSKVKKYRHPVIPAWLGARSVLRRPQPGLTSLEAWGYNAIRATGRTAWQSAKGLVELIKDPSIITKIDPGKILDAFGKTVDDLNDPDPRVSGDAAGTLAGMFLSYKIPAKFLPKVLRPVLRTRVARTARVVLKRKISRFLKGQVGKVLVSFGDPVFRRVVINTGRRFLSTKSGKWFVKTMIGKWVFKKIGINRVVIGRMGHLRRLFPGEKTLADHLLKMKATTKAYWKRNAGVLRREMKKGLPIRDASVNPYTGRLIEYPGTFLHMERNLLKTHGWIYRPRTRLWMPPGG